MSISFVLFSLFALVAVASSLLLVKLWGLHNKSEYSNPVQSIQSLLSTLVSGSACYLFLQYSLKEHIAAPSLLSFLLSLVLASTVLLSSVFDRTKRKQASSIFSLIAIVLSILGFSQSILSVSRQDILSADSTIVPGELISSKTLVGITDQGRRIRLMEWDILDSDFQAYVRRNDSNLQKLASNAIRRSEPDKKSNCHGWVFGEGQCIIPCDLVDRILDDNEYSAVKQPAVNDVVIYRDNLGNPIHSGIVRGVLENGVVMIESKFGIEGCYLHTLDQQPYSQAYTFHHTERGSHSIQITSPSVASRKPSVVTNDDQLN